jgi:hypothetical protein
MPNKILNWQVGKLTGTAKGLMIRSQIIKWTAKCTLRSLATNINIRGRLHGNSLFWIFSRVDENIELSKPVCILKKMPDS